MEEGLFYALLGDKIATFLSGLVVIAIGLIGKYMVENWLAGRRLRDMGFQYNNKFSFRGISCKIINIFAFRTVIERLDTGEQSSPIENSRLEHEVIWMSRGNGNDKKVTNS